MNHASLFSGIGGFDLAAEWIGWDNVFSCEIDPWCQRVLRHRFPLTKHYGDIRSINGKEYRGKIDILTGGFPCQPFSNAGRRGGANDDRFLWPEMLRIITEARPTWIIGENVAGLLSMAQFDSEPAVDDEGCAIGNVGDTHDRHGQGILKGIMESLEKENYEVQPVVIPACAIGAWHRRDRVWIIAHTEENNDHGNGREFPQSDEQAQSIGSKKWVSKPDRSTPQSHPHDWKERNKRFKFQPIPKLRGIQRGEDERVYANIEGRPDLSTPVLCGSYDGIPDGMDRVAAYGNAIVPQVAYEIFKAIEFVSSASIDDHA